MGIERWQRGAQKKLNGQAYQGVDEGWVLHHAKQLPALPGEGTLQNVDALVKGGGLLGSGGEQPPPKQQQEEDGRYPIPFPHHAPKPRKTRWLLMWQTVCISQILADLVHKAATNRNKQCLPQGNCILFNQRALSANSRCPIQLSAAWF